jgi:hypothetical protein
MFWYDFVVGDDWRVAAGVVIALAVTGALVRAGVGAWWFMPPAVALLFGWSLHRATAGRRGQEQASPGPGAQCPPPSSSA